MQAPTLQMEDKMTTHFLSTKTLSSWGVRLFRVTFALIFALSLVGLQPAGPAAASIYLASCNGCETTMAGSSVIFTFNGSGDFTPLVDNLSVNILIVGGGGGGGGRASSTSATYGGGGGAGGFVEQNGTVLIKDTAYNVTVGDGGAYGTGTAKGINGGDSAFGSYTAKGGGG
jgi:hypothetical protein